MITKSEAHIHEYKDIEILRITKIDNGKYQGDTGDKSILLRACTCDKKQAFEYGAHKDMKVLFDKLRRAR